MTALTALKLVKRGSVAADAFEQVRGLITSHALAPGERLPPQRLLAERLGVSRASLREAIRALATLGLLEIRHGNGTYVSNLSSETLALPLTFLVDSNGVALRDLFEVRLMLEVGAAQAAATKIDAAGLSQLEQVLERGLGSIHSIEPFVDADIEFHHVVHEASGNELLLALMESLSALGRKSRMLTAQHLNIRKRAAQDHRAIFLALAAHDRMAAGNAMAAHLAHVREPSERRAR